MSEMLVPVGGAMYWGLLFLLMFSRGADFLSTWIATPGLVLEGNPIARRLGWKWGILLNGILCMVFAAWPLSAIALATTSVLVAARNFQNAWLMRTIGEFGYRDWYVQRIQQTSRFLYLFCLAGQILLIAGVGGALMIFYDGLLIPFAVGLGILTYAVAVLVYTLLSFWKIRRAAG